MTYPAGPGTPVVNGVGDMSVDEFLTDPTRIQRTIEAIPSRYFLGDFLLRPGEANGGVVIYDELTDLDLYVNADPNRQPGEIEPGSEFPAVDVTDSQPNVALVAKRGGYFSVTDEQKRRDRRDVVRRGLLRLSNTLVKLEDARVVNAVVNNATVVAHCTTPAAAAWDTAGGTGVDIKGDVRGGRSAIDYSDLPYTTDTILINPDAYDVLMDSDAVNNRLPRENVALNPILTKEVRGLFGIENWVINNRVPRTKVILLQRQMAGALSSEIPPKTDVIDERIRERVRVQASRVNVPVITDPYSVHVISGVLS